MATFDAHKNFSISLIAVAPTPAASGTTFNVTAGEGALFPAVSFNAVVWPAGTNPTAANAEIVRVTNKGTGDNWTATRVTESSNARSIAVGDQIMAAITAKTITDIETATVASAYTAKTGTYVAVANDLVSCTSGTFTVTLPAASANANKPVWVVNNGTGVITVAPNGSDTVGLAATQTLGAATASSQGDSMAFVSDGISNWNIV